MLEADTGFDEFVDGGNDIGNLQPRTVPCAGESYLAMPSRMMMPLASKTSAKKGVGKHSVSPVHGRKDRDMFLYFLAIFFCKLLVRLRIALQASSRLRVHRLSLHPAAEFLEPGSMGVGPGARRRRTEQNCMKAWLIWSPAKVQLPGYAKPNSAGNTQFQAEGRITENLATQLEIVPFFFFFFFFV